MSFFYTILQLFALVFLLPVLAIMAMFSAKYKERIPRRLGMGLKVPGKKAGHPRIWIHALSVGEVISAKPLVKALRQEIPGCELFFSSVTQGGQLVALEMAEAVDQFIPFPFDFFFTVTRFIRRIEPDVFVLVETDFWPNIIWQLHDNAIPCILVNGRMAQKSFARYRLLRPVFASFFNSFAALSMQMERGVNQLQALGVAPGKALCNGNLKFDLELCLQDAPDLSKMTAVFPGRLVFVAGSTHKGEEALLLEAYIQASKIQKNLLLVLAPRNIERAESVRGMAVSMGLAASLRSSRIGHDTQVIILDTLGELVYLYHFADIAFVGGSLVDERGHNPLEPAYWGKIVIFGPFMEDFFEASQGLLGAKAAKEVSPANLSQTLGWLCANPEVREAMGRNAAAFVGLHQGAARKTSRLIKRIMNAHVC
jgi:3-deoxy-D-manno-octulosonic-acid transferase